MKKSTILNIIFTVVILVAALGLLLWQRTRTPAESTQAQLTYGDNNTVMDIPLNKDETYTVDTGYLTVTIQVQDGQARFINSVCPDHVCENYGWISVEDQQAVCVPGHAVLMIVPAA